MLVDDRGPIPWRVESAAFARTRGSIRSNKHRLLLIDAPPATPGRAPADLAAAIRAGPRAALDGLLNPRLKNFGCRRSRNGRA